MVVYKITNKINGKIYIGQTIRTIHKRWVQHCGIHEPTMMISHAIKKYGKENFTIEEIDRCDSIEDLNKKEIFWINSLNSTSNSVGYNVCLGGINSPMSEETKKKISIKSKKQWEDPEYREKMSNLYKERWKDPEFREKHKKAMESIDKGAFKKKMSIINKETSRKRYHKEFTVHRAVLSEKKGWQKPAKYTKGEFIGIWGLKRQCAKDLIISETGISAVLSKRTKMSKGYVFEYVEKVNNDE